MRPISACWFAFFAAHWLLYLAGSGMAAPAKVVSAPQYRAQLQQAENVLRRMAARPPRPLKKVLQGLAAPRVVRRADGATFSVRGDAWQRRASELSSGNNSGTRDDVQRALAAVQMQRDALDEWMRASNGSYYEAADAQTIVNQLEQTGQIRTGPTRLQEMWAAVTKYVRDTWESFLRWISSLFPAPTSRPRPPQIDPNLIKLLFVLSVIALLGVIGFLLWRSLGGRWGRESARRHLQFAAEDAELLALPPDELHERARQFAQAGDFREALRHLYIALLLRLDMWGVWQYNARRTNWEHIATLRKSTSQAHAAQAWLVAPLSDLTRRFDRVRYGNAACAQSDWLRFERDVLTLQEKLQHNSAPGQASEATPATASGVTP